MKIAIIAGTFFPFAGGAQIEVHNLATKLSKYNDVTVLTFNKSNIKNTNYKIKIFNKLILNFLYILNHYLNININFTFKYIKLFDKSYDIYHFNFLTYKSLILIDYLNCFNKKILITFQGADLQINKKINYGFRLNKKYEKLLFKIIQKNKYFQTISSTIEHDLKKIKNNDIKIIKIPNSVNIQKFDKILYKKKNKRITLLTVGRYARLKKGYDAVPEITKLLIDHKIPFLWYIIGSGTKKLYNNNIVLKNKDRIKIFENIFKHNSEKYFPSKKLVKLYKSSDIYLNLARIESFGITLIESFAAGIPVLSYDCKSSKELITNNMNGHIIKKRDNKLLVNKIIELYKNKNKLKKIKKGSKKKSHLYNLDINSKNIFYFYKKIIKD